jgi:elongation factor P
MITVRTAHVIQRAGRRVQERGVKILASEVRRGLLLELEGKLLTVMSAKHVAHGQRAGYIQCDLRDIKDGTKAAKRFGSADKVESVKFDNTIPYKLLYKEGDKLVLMHETTFEQTEIPDTIVDEIPRKFLTDGIDVTVHGYSGVPISGEIPKELELIVSSDLKIFSDGKLVELENGVEIKTPLYVNIGDKIIVRTVDASYVRRA